MLLRSGDNEALAVGEDIPEGVILEQAEGIVGGEAGPLSGSGQGGPGAGGGRAGEAAQETGELAWSAEGAVALVQQGPDRSHMRGGETRGGCSRNVVAGGMEAGSTVTTRLRESLSEVGEQVAVEAVLLLRVGEYLL